MIKLSNGLLTKDVLLFELLELDDEDDGDGDDDSLVVLEEPILLLLLPVEVVVAVVITAEVGRADEEDVGGVGRGW